VALLRPLANAAGFIEILGVAAKQSRDWREAGESEAGPVVTPVNKEARLAPETPTLAAQPGKPPVVTPDDCGAHGDVAVAVIAGLSALQMRTLMDERVQHLVMQLFSLRFALCFAGWAWHVLV